MTLEQILEHRRAVRKYDADKEIDTEKVKECIRLASRLRHQYGHYMWNPHRWWSSWRPFPSAIRRVLSQSINRGSMYSIDNNSLFGLLNT